MKINQLSTFNILDYLKTEEDIAGYLQAVNEDGDPALIKYASLDIELARANL
ncbi:DNA-binding protein [Polynucleobacter sp. AP-RePozz3-80-G7]|uniref:helix-turn-helix domain-containing transcriptional regulator n=1 Tax=Polynucleobacter sp. AP-RePozz3-80-G7 TaxID=2689105 RepID=UPI001C0BFDA0|nr:hypothetical protein [Polynucleobacter sp. AP-RePozz3-80-G7]MBU3638499.1 hypothetical protein [Polynucleobacter sp. AP-RePozz3-80-G7]